MLWESALLSGVTKLIVGLTGCGGVSKWHCCRPFTTLSGGVNAAWLSDGLIGEAAGDMCIDVGKLWNEELPRCNTPGLRGWAPNPGIKAPAARASTKPGPSISMVGHVAINNLMTVIT